MADSRYEFVENAHRYRDKASGRFVSPTVIEELRDQVLASQREAMAELARKLAEREISVRVFEESMRDRIKAAQTLDYAFGRGGRQAMTAEDRQALGALVADQYTYLRSFAEDAAAGRMTAGQIRARADLYGASANLAFERGRAASYRGLDLPAQPGQGTVCKSRCRCSWDIQESETEYRAYWRLHASESCETCVGRASAYSPYVQPKTRMLRVVEAA